MAVRRGEERERKRCDSRVGSHRKDRERRSVQGRDKETPIGRMREKERERERMDYGNRVKKR